MTMQVCSTIAELSAVRARFRTVGLVPTMGSLHEGHLSLVRQAKAACDAVAVSIFNRIWPPPLGGGQPTVFKPGSRDDVAKATFNPLGFTAWVLGSDVVIANAHSRPCAHK